MSSNSIVSQGLKSCLDHEPRVLFHQSTSSKQDLSSPWPHNQIQIPLTEKPKKFPVENLHGTDTNSKKTWNFTQSVQKKSFKCPKSNLDSMQQVYVHPLDKSSVFSLSTKSLEMCTESLGCETGSKIDSNKEEYSYLLLKKQSCTIKKKSIARKVKHISSFPPPLTSISGIDGVQVTTHRDGGRLIIKAFKYSSCKNYFETKRENGRLRLSLPETENEVVEEKADYEAEDDFGFLMEEQLNGGKIGGKMGTGEWSSSRCNGDRSGNFVKLPFCSVAIS